MGRTIVCCRASVRGFARIRGISLLLSLYCGSLFAAGVANPALPDVPPGLEYLHHRIGNGPWSIHVVKVDRTAARFRLISTLAQDHVYGLAPVSRQVAGLRNVRPVAAVNGDFFVIQPGPYQGDPSGLHVVQSELISSPTGVSFWIDDRDRPHIGEVAARFRATGPDGLNLSFGLNQECGADEAVLYTPAIGASTRTDAGLELILVKAGDGAWLPLRPGGSYRAMVAVVTERSNTELTPTTMVLAIGPALTRKLPAITPGTVLTLHLTTVPDLTGVTTAIGGRPILLDNGESPEWSPSLARHPRTAVGWNDDQFILAVVDGRQEGLSVGMTYPELASLMKGLGCEYAVNLDGGGSSTLWLDGHVMNSPSDGRERAVANSLVVISTEPNEIPEGLQNR